jgi:hypothetical protein
MFWLLSWVSAATAQITIQGGSQGNPRPAGPQSQHPSQVTIQYEMTPQQAARLMGFVDEIIAFDSKATGLPVRGYVERQITNRDELKKLASKRMQEEDAVQKMQRSSAILKKFGLFPRDFDLQQFAVESAANDLAGYYDPRVKTMYLLNWLPPSAQLPAMAHELDHALQDQNFDLQKWMQADDPSANGPTGGDPSEQRGARRAVVEGHATAAMMEYLLSKQGRSLMQLPVLSPDLIQRWVDRFGNPRTTQVPPLLLREESAFPYLYGLVFVHQVLRRAGKEQAYSGIFKRPPESTRQIMEPGTYLAHEKLAPLPMPALDALLGKGHEKLESGSLGEFDCMIFIKQFGTPEQANKIPAYWRGDYFYAARRIPAAAGDEHPAAAQVASIEPKDVSLLFVSRWASPSAARDFATFYRTTVPRRYSDAKPAGQSRLEPAEVEEWATGEGKVTVHVEGNLVVVLEGFDEETASRVRAAVLKADKQ